MVLLFPSLIITRTGSTLLSTPKSFTLSNVLYAPTMKRNIISISQFCHENNLVIEFSSDCFLMKDRLTRAAILKGPTKNGIYEWPSSIVAFTAIKSYAIDWHHRLGHPSLSIFKSLVSSFNLNISNNLSFNCNACQCNKSYKLPFNKNTLISTSPLELLYTDLWTSPIHSFDGFKYYVIFMDHFTKYIWFYPLKNKSDTKEVFIRFKAIVEKFFQKPIKTIYSDNGGEYVALSSYLTFNGVFHLTTPPHTPKHNGYVERRHRQIIEIGLSLLSHSHLPLKFWSLAFSTTYLINRLITPTLSDKSPFHCLFFKPPNYLKLKCFGCLCYPWLRPYAQHKLDTRSLPCIFIGYSATQSAYYCLDPTTHKIYISRHVRFLENEFPYSTLSYTKPTSPYPNPDTWCPIFMPILQSFPAPVQNESAASDSTPSQSEPYSPLVNSPISSKVTPLTSSSPLTQSSQTSTTLISQPEEPHNSPQNNHHNSLQK